MICFECDQPADHQHHVIPKSRGGKRTIPLCTGCHGRVHERNFPVNHRTLTIEGLRRAKARGVKLGNLISLREAQEKGAQGNVEAANAFAIATLPIIETYQRQGLTVREIARELNKAGVKTLRQGRWHGSTVVKTLQRAYHINGGSL